MCTTTSLLHIKALAKTKQKISLRVRSEVELEVPFCEKANLHKQKICELN